MEIITYPDKEVSVCRPELGKISMANGQDFQDSLKPLMRKGARIVLDLSNVRFIDSSGLGKIVASLREIRSVGGEIRICSAQPSVMDLFEMVHLAEIVAIHSDAEAAVASFAAGGCA